MDYPYKFKGVIRWRVKSIFLIIGKLMIRIMYPNDQEAIAFF